MNRIVRSLLGLAIGLLMAIGITFFLQSSQATAQTDPDRSQVIQAAAAYLRAQQQADGGILGFSGVSDPDTTARTVLAFIATGEPISEVVTSSGVSMVDYLATQVVSFTHDTTGTLFPGRAGEILSAVALTSQDPTNFGGMDLVSEIEASFLADTGVYSTTAKQDFSSGGASDLNQAWAILGLSLAGQDLPESAIQYLLDSQGEDGSWGFGDPDTTALVVTALIASQKTSIQDQAIQKALQYFHSTQAESGGWKPSWDTDPLNADSTGWILQALVSAGEDPQSQAWVVNGVSPVDALMALQKPDGSIGGTYANPYSTAEAIIGLSGVSLSNQRPSVANNQAGLAIFSGDGSVYTACVSFPESIITGLDLLQRSGAELETATNPTQGTAVCKIGDVGCQSNDCFCSMPNYWSYWQAGENGWEYAQTGAEQNEVKNGDVNAWSWGVGDPPASISYANICEGVPFTLPEATQTSLPPTEAPTPTKLPSIAPATITSQPTSTAVAPKTGPGSYVVYAVMVVILAGLIIYLVRFRPK